MAIKTTATPIRIGIEHNCIDDPDDCGKCDDGVEIIVEGLLVLGSWRLCSNHDCHRGLRNSIDRQIAGSSARQRGESIDIDEAERAIDYITTEDTEYVYSNRDDDHPW